MNGGQIVAEKTGTRTIVYIYDASGTPIGMMYRTTSYAEGAFDVFWYEKNLQGDIVAVYNSSGTKLVTYDYYDAWGNYTVSYSNNGATTGAQYNPFRYRGYYYDTDLGMYYLQSRYYDAKICRFISADRYISTGQGMISFNMFAYCNNNPVNYYDPCGESLIEWIKSVIEHIKELVDKMKSDTAEDIRDNSGGPVDKQTLRAGGSAIQDTGNYSYSNRYYLEGGGSHMLPSMYEDVYNDLIWFE